MRHELSVNLIFGFVDGAGISEAEKQRLLHCVVVGGGPTGVEFSGELSDFITRDVHQRYAHVKNYIHVTLIEVCFQKVKNPDSGFIVFNFLTQ